MTKANWNTMVVLLGLLLLVMQVLYLHRLPGLFGDEASEGLNVFGILTGESFFTILGERSYIGPLIDYLRIPFVAIFGYTALALRIPMVIASLVTFALAAEVFRRLVGEQASFIILTALFFSPVYLLYQRLGWAVTLFPFFACLLLYVLICYKGPQKPLVAGLVAGLGLHNYVTFLPTIAGILVAASVWVSIKHRPSWSRFHSALTTWWPLVAGFWATFGTQFGVLNLYQEDQGDPAHVASQVFERVADLPKVLPQLLSGAVYIASYGGDAVPQRFISIITIVLCILCLAALVLRPYRTLAWVWLTGMAVQLSSLLIMIDRFTLRYFVIFNLATWALAGLGVASLVTLLSRPKASRRFVALYFIPALVLSSFVLDFAFIPFLQTGGQWRYFSLDNPRSTAEIKVDIIPLLACLRGKALVYSDDIHIQTRLEYLQYSDPHLLLASGKESAKWHIYHRQPNNPKRSSDEACPELTNFVVVVP